MKVLLVDDSKAARFAMSKLLKDQGLEVEVAASGEEALDKIATEDINMVFMDQSMPGMGGLAATTAITSNEKTQHIPVVLCTGNEGEKLEQMAEEAGAIGVLTKPPEEAKLVQLLQQLKSGAEQEAPAEEAAAPAEAAAPSHEAIIELQKAIEALQAQIQTLQSSTDEKIASARKDTEAKLQPLAALKASVDQIDSKISTYVQDQLSKEAGNQRIQLEALRQQVETGLDNMQELEQKLRSSILSEAHKQINALVNDKLASLKDSLKDTQHQVDTTVHQLSEKVSGMQGSILGKAAAIALVFAGGAFAAAFFLLK